MLGVRPGGIESYRPLPQLGVLPRDHENMDGSPWLLHFVTGAFMGERADPLEERAIQLLGDAVQLWRIMGGKFSCRACIC